MKSVTAAKQEATMLSKQLRNIALVVAVFATGLTACVIAPPEEDPMVQRLTALDGRLLRIERILSNQSLLEQSQKTETLSTDVRAIRGLVEQLQHQLESTRNQQRELYADIDRRMQALEGRASAGPSTPTAAATDDNAAYKVAFDLLKDGKYAEATNEFTQFLSAYPQSALRDNAQYWLGEARYVGKDFAQALRDFRTVVEKYPESRKLPDAWLKIGYCQYELKNWKEARDALRRVSQLVPGTPSAGLAEQRLAKMQAEGH
ncbi:MAG: tol-pal system protein YbgF [Candidatus Obscuribacterales bacterium]|nr:tol-pal system protein YbgF [Steroidobacteraceae bacterium]